MTTGTNSLHKNEVMQIDTVTVGTALTVAGVTIDASTLAMTDLTASAAELNYNDITTLGTGAASKSVVLDAGDDYTWPATGVLTYGVLKDHAGSTLQATVAELNRAADTSTRLVPATGTLAVTEALHDGKVIALDTAAGSICTLPAATGSGAFFRFLVTVTATTNSHIIKVTTNDTMTGFVLNNDVDGTAPAFYKATSTDDTITMNRTTTGGVIGDYIECIDMLTDLWFIRGMITCVAGSNIATPFSATVT